MSIIFYGPTSKVGVLHGNFDICVELYSRHYARESLFITVVFEIHTIHLNIIHSHYYICITKLSLKITTLYTKISILFILAIFMLTTFVVRSGISFFLSFLKFLPIKVRMWRPMSDGKASLVRMDPVIVDIDCKPSLLVLTKRGVHTILFKHISYKSCLHRAFLKKYRRLLAA